MPTPAVPRYSATGEPSPPAPMTSACDVEQPLLAFDADLVEQDVARVAQQLVVVHAPMHDANKERPARARAFSWAAARRSVRRSASALRSVIGLADQHRLALQVVQRLRELEVFGAAELGQRLGRLACVLASCSSSFLRASSRAFSRASSFFSSAAAEVLLEVGLAHAQRGEHVALGGLVEHHVGHDALGLDRAAARRVVARGGDLQRGVVADSGGSSAPSPCRRSARPSRSRACGPAARRRRSRWPRPSRR